MKEVSVSKIKWVLGLLLLYLFVGAVSSGDEEVPEQLSAPTPTVLVESTKAPVLDSSTAHKVVSVTDGDTFKVDVDGTIETVRIVGINTPETVDPRTAVECFGKEASLRLRSLLLDASVALQKDPTQSDRDRYGRLLRFVFIDSVDVGLLMIKEGYAEESLYSSVPHVYRDQYVAAEKDAQESKRGLWADDACPSPEPVVNATPGVTSGTPISSSLTESGNGSATFPVQNSTGYSCTGVDLDCSDFATQAQAQEFFDGCGFTAMNDPMRLDLVEVGDGVACESLP